MTLIDAILLGNAGSGKSWLGNILAEQAVFTSGYAPSHVTTKHKASRTPQQLRNGVRLNVHDTPGLEESSDVETFKAHRTELHEAFTSSIGEQVVLLVIDTNPGGRAKDADMKLLRKVSKAYGLQSHSVLLVINMVRAASMGEYERDFISSLPVDIKTLYHSVLSIRYSANAGTEGFLSTPQGSEVKAKLLTGISALQAARYSLKAPQALECDVETSVRLTLELEQRQAAATAAAAAYAQRQREAAAAAAAAAAATAAAAAAEAQWQQQVAEVQEREAAEKRELARQVVIVAASVVAGPIGGFIASLLLSSL